MSGESSPSGCRGGSCGGDQLTILVEMLPLGLSLGNFSPYLLLAYRTSSLNGRLLNVNFIIDN